MDKIVLPMDKMVLMDKFVLPMDKMAINQMIFYPREILPPCTAGCRCLYTIKEIFMQYL